MQRLLRVISGLLSCILIAAPVLADSTVHDLSTNTTSPLPASSCIYVDQGSTTDTKLCSGWAAAFGGVTGLSVPGSSIFGITGTAALSLTTTGTSGGFPFFDTTSTLSSSALMTNHAPIIGGGAGAAPKTTAALTNGQLLIGSTSADPVPASLTAGSNVTITPGAGSITIASTGGGATLAAGSNVTISEGTPCSSGTCTINSTVGAGTIVNNSIGGCTLSNDGGTPNSVIDVSACTAADSTNAALISAGAFTKSTAGAWASGTGSNGMGNGLTIANSTWYHVCLANNGGTADYWFDTSVTCANRPSGISDTKYRRVGSFRTDGSANILAFFQYGDIFVWKIQKNDANNQTYGTTPTLVTLTVPTGVAVQAHISLYTSISGGALLAYTPAASTTDTSNGSLSCAGSAAGGDRVTCSTWVITNTSAQIDILAGVASTTGTYINTFEWRDFRGQ